MPCYFIDTDDGALALRDAKGRDYANVEAARSVAQRALAEMVQGQKSRAKPYIFTAAIRDENGAVLHVATLTLVGKWQASLPLG